MSFFISFIFGFILLSIIASLVNRFLLKAIVENYTYVERKRNKFREESARKRKINGGIEKICKYGLSFSQKLYADKVSREALLSYSKKSA